MRRQMVTTMYKNRLDVHISILSYFIFYHYPFIYNFIFLSDIQLVICFVVLFFFSFYCPLARIPRATSSHALID